MQTFAKYEHFMDVHIQCRIRDENEEIPFNAKNKHILMLFFAIFISVNIYDFMVFCLFRRGNYVSHFKIFECEKLLRQKIIFQHSDKMIFYAMTKTKSGASKVTHFIQMK